MSIDYNVLAQPKGPTRKRLKARKDRAEGVVKRCVRAVVADRDGYCRYSTDNGHDCLGGASEWAHWGDKKRFKTRGMPAGERHTTAGSLMLCKRHHQYYDAGTLIITAKTDRGCDGPLKYRWRAA